MLFGMCDVSPAPAAGALTCTSSGVATLFRVRDVSACFCSAAFTVGGCPVAGCMLGAYSGTQTCLCKFYSVPGRLIFS